MAVLELDRNALYEWEQTGALPDEYPFIALTGSPHGESPSSQLEPNYTELQTETIPAAQSNIPVNIKVTRPGEAAERNKRLTKSAPVPLQTLVRIELLGFVESNTINHPKKPVVEKPIGTNPSVYTTPARVIVDQLLASLETPRNRQQAEIRSTEQLRLFNAMRIITTPKVKERAPEISSQKHLGSLLADALEDESLILPELPDQTIHPTNISKQANWRSSPKSRFVRLSRFFKK